MMVPPVGRRAHEPWLWVVYVNTVGLPGSGEARFLGDAPPPPGVAAHRSGGGPTGSLGRVGSISRTVISVPAAIWSAVDAWACLNFLP